MAVFTGISAYGILGHLGIGAEAARPATLGDTLLFAAGTAPSIAGIGFFGIQLDQRKSEERRAKSSARRRRPP